MIAEIQDQPREALQRGGLVEVVGSENIVGSLELAVALSGQIALERPKPRRTPTV